MALGYSCSQKVLDYVTKYTRSLCFYFTDANSRSHLADHVHAVHQRNLQSFACLQCGQPLARTAVRKGKVTPYLLCIWVFLLKANSDEMGLEIGFHEN